MINYEPMSDLALQQLACQNGSAVTGFRIVAHIYASALKLRHVVFFVTDRLMTSILLLILRFFPEMALKMTRTHKIHVYSIIYQHRWQVGVTRSWDCPERTPAAVVSDQEREESRAMGSARAMGTVLFRQIYS